MKMNVAFCLRWYMDFNDELDGGLIENTVGDELIMKFINNELTILMMTKTT